MAKLKYFDRIEQDQAAQKALPPGPLPQFDFESLRTKSRLKRWATRFALRRLLPFVAAILRLVWPNPKYKNVVFVTRRADVEEVLGDPANFKVVYEPEMKELGSGFNNVLGEDGPDHDRLHALLRKTLSDQHLGNVGKWVSEDAHALLERAGGQIDIFRDLFTRTASETSCRLFGLDPLDRDQFAQWTMAVSNQLFGDFFGDANIRQQSQTAAAHLRAVIDDAIDRVEANNRLNPASRRKRETLIDRLITDEKVPRGEVRASILGLITAFMPTNSLAAGNIMEVLLEKPRLMRHAKAAAKLDDRAALEAILLEAGARNPALSPGLWRHRPEEAEPIEIGRGKRGSRMIQPGDLILACIPSALRQNRSDIRSDAWLMFGHGPHVCFGAQIALDHLTSVFAALLSREDLERVCGKEGRMERIGPFPVRMDMRYKHIGSRRALMVLRFPVDPKISRETVDKKIRRLGNPAEDFIRASLKDTAIQFASLNVIEKDEESTESVILLELSGDGEDYELLKSFAKASYSWLAPILAFCHPRQHAPEHYKVLLRRFERGLIHVSFRPWGSTGLHFDGLPELSVEDIKHQEELADFAAAVVNTFVKRGTNLSARAMDVLQRTRRLVRRDSFLMLRKGNRKIRNASRLERNAVLRPSRKRLRIADWRPHRSIFGPVPGMIIDRGNRLLLGSLTVGWIAALTALTIWLGPDRTAPFWEWWIVAPIPLLIGSFLALLITIAGAFAIFMAAIRWKELRDPSDTGQASLEQVEALVAREDHPGYAHNHITAVMPFKTGILRRLSFAFSMWGIAQSVTHWFRPGFVLTMGTIHKARWFRVPNTNQFVFFSNYDGSWESYLEDFITRAHEGQSAAWSHGVGFPPTKYLIGDGAKDGDRFKRWVRKQQRETPFWYTRFPNLTAERIRTNAMIADGLNRATTDTDARRWMSLFGSAQRPTEELEVQEVQTLVFSGFPKHKKATAMFIRLPSDKRRAGEWISAVSGQRALTGEASSDQPLPSEWFEQTERGVAIEVPLDARVRFGEYPSGDGGTTLGLTGSALQALGLNDRCGFQSLPEVFRMTMARRSDLLGDDTTKLHEWRIADHSDHEHGAQAMLVVYGSEGGRNHAETVENHSNLLRHLGGKVVHTVPCNAARDNRLDTEHFGFRDGISQPVIKGTSRASQEIPERDLIAAGEFILGYPNGQGFTSPPISVGTENDVSADLPAARASRTNRFPWFGPRPTETEWRDFGRNGTFIAVRQLDQDKPGFDKGMKRIAHRLRKIERKRKELSELIGGPIDDRWVAAKIMGRWQDGTPLVGHSRPDGTSSPNERVDNDFTYGRDDPRGLECPLGSHIRRANPRDSKEAGDPEEQDITNRHRLLRRGRAYTYEADGGEAKGLLFMAICADLERQFEFVQRSWLNTTSFHGLVEEVDPLLGGDRNDPSQKRPGFTIPTSAGPVRIPETQGALQSYVEVKGGGYFFLPSRSALRFLIRRSQSGAN
ncbi:MAG: hypothetical protein ABJP70_05825 [Erythrobacter sp.]